MTGDRFGFGENWARYAATVGDAAAAAAQASLTDAVGSLAGKRFLDIGAGSGLFARAAADLGADVTAFDYDPSPGALYPVTRGDILNAAFVESLGVFDVVYAWGVLHHTGSMWRAIENAASRVAEGGWLFISIYNDQEWRSGLWTMVKRTYNRLPSFARPVFAAAVVAPAEARAVVRDVARGRNYLKSWRESPGRGMSKWRDIVDWVGGYPFEVARPEDIFEFLHQRGFALEHLRTKGRSHGCNEFVFRRSATPSAEE